MANSTALLRMKGTLVTSLFGKAAWGQRHQEAGTGTGIRCFRRIKVPVRKL